MLKLNIGQSYKLYKHFLCDEDPGVEATYLGKAQIYTGKTPKLATINEHWGIKHIFVDKDGLYYLVEWQLEYDQPYLQIIKSGRNLTFLLYNFKQSFVSLEGQPKPNDYLDCSYSKDKDSE